MSHNQLTKWRCFETCMTSYKQTHQAPHMLGGLDLSQWILGWSNQLRVGSGHDNQKPNQGKRRYLRASGASDSRTLARGTRLRVLVCNILFEDAPCCKPLCTLPKH